MKKLTATALLLLPAAAIFAQSGAFTVKGSLPDAGPSKVFLLYNSEGKNLSDSTDVVNGSFEFKGTIANPTMGTLLVSHSGQTLGALRRTRKVDLLLKLFMASSICDYKSYKWQPRRTDAAARSKNKTLQFRF